MFNVSLSLASIVEFVLIRLASMLPDFTLHNFVLELKIVIFAGVLYGCESWSLTSGEEHRLRVFENRVLGRIFGPKREEDGSWRKLHNDELHSLYSSPNIVRVII
jgi:hypothetical protein